MDARPRARPGLTPKEQARVRRLFDAALELPTAERGPFLAESCEDSAAVLQEVRQLLDAHASSASWLDRPLLSPADKPAMEESMWVGRQIGPYQIQRLVATGGMGSVYLAERSIGKVRQNVALKVIRPTLITNSEMVKRFEQEREILASLDHPNIARLLDVGSSGEGVPFLVMEYVEGEPIDDWCDVRALGIQARLELFRTACTAIEYAHRKRVIHRDIKPGNILITTDGTLKLLDFGIGKFVHSEEENLALATRTGAGLMTLEYASPEQVRGEKVGAASDTYSLGVVLYELLTGKRPYHVEGQMIHALAQAICDEEPATPSAAIPETASEIAARRATTPRALRRQIAGDLDAIVLKALRKKPEWRYDSPGALGDDISRHMAGDRVSARRDTMRYRLERVVHQLFHPTAAVFHTHGMMMWTAGFMGFLLLLERHEIFTGRKRKPDAILDAAILAVWIVWSTLERHRMASAGRFSAMDRLSWTMFTVIAVVLGTITVVAALRPFIPVEAMAVFWNAGLSIGLLVVGLQASRIMTAGGVILLASALLAIFQPRSVYLWLAAGMFGGMVVPGLIFTLQGASGRLKPLVNRRKRLFTDAKSTEDPVQDIVSGGSSGDRVHRGERSV